MSGDHQGYNADGVAMRDFYVSHKPVDLACDPAEGMTRQEFKDECDLNVLLARYEKTGQLPANLRGPGDYLDVSNIPDLAGALTVFHDAENAFMRLPATVRREFDNDPVRFVEFAQDPGNQDRMAEWGLAAPRKPADAPSPSAATPPAAASNGSTEGASA